MSIPTINGISPWVIGQTHPTWSFTWVDDQGAAINLTGATVTLWIFNGVGTTQAGGGTVTVPTPSTGVVNYVPVAADTTGGLVNGKPGVFWVALKAVFADASVLWQYPAIQWLVTQLP